MPERKRRRARVAQEDCVACGCCVKVCPLGAIQVERGLFARVEHIPIASSHLDRVAAVNQLSREIAEGRHTVPEARAILEGIQKSPEKKNLFRVLASGVGSGAFCILFGGTAGDALAALLNDRAVLDLYDDVRTELSVQWLEFEIGLFGAVGIRGTVDESAPHDNTFIRLQGIGQHVGTFGMSAPEVARAGLAFGVSFH